MKLFGWKPREEARPALSRGAAGPAMGDWPRSYEAQVREGYLGNAIAQRAVKLVMETIGGAPLLASHPRLIELATMRSGGQTLVETVAAQLLLHGNAYGGAVPSGYALRGGDPTAALDAALVRCDGLAAGDVLVMATGPGQLHLAVRTARGFVHADAGLRRVVERAEADWPVIGAWRMGG
jgi:hypothetical protein